MQFASLSVLPAKVGIQQKQIVLDSGFRRKNGNIVILRKSCIQVNVQKCTHIGNTFVLLKRQNNIHDLVAITWLLYIA